MNSFGDTSTSEGFNYLQISDKENELNCGFVLGPFRTSYKICQ